MTLKELFEVVSESQDVVLIVEGLDDEIKAPRTTLECVLTEQVQGAKVDCVEAEFDGDLKVWVKCDG